MYVRALAHFVILHSNQNVHTFRPGLRRCCASLISLTQHTCSNLSTYPCYHMSIFHLCSFKRHILFHPKHISIHLFIYSQSPATTPPPRIKERQIGISSVLDTKTPIISTSHFFSPISAYSSLKSFFLSRTLSAIALMT